MSPVETALYHVSFHGQNFLIEGPYGRIKMAFFTSRFITASSPEAAEQEARENIHNDESILKIMGNPENDPARLEMEEIKPVHALPQRHAQLSEISWYAEED